MDLNSWKERRAIVRNLAKDASDLADTLNKKLGNEYDDTGEVIDDYYLLRIVEANLWGLTDLMDAERLFLLTVLQVEEEKSKFVVQKNLHEFIKDSLYMHMNEIVFHQTKTVEFSDYRIKRWQDDARKGIKLLCDWYHHEYLSNS